MSKRLLVGLAITCTLATASAFNAPPVPHTGMVWEELAAYCSNPPAVPDLEFLKHTYGATIGLATYNEAVDHCLYINRASIRLPNLEVCYGLHANDPYCWE